MSSVPAIGIDLGTTFSEAAVYRNGRSEIIPDKEGNRLTPSLIFYHRESLDVSVGSTADDLGLKNIKNFLFDIKRIIGRKYDDAYVQKLKFSDEYRFNIVRGEDDKAEIELIHDGIMVRKTPEQASSEVLKYLRESASEYLGAEVTEAVISVPAYFSNAQRKATRAAAELAGLKVLKLITEPVAAAIHYTENKLGTKGNLLVFDFGGGTLDVSIIRVDGKTFQVKSVEGDTFLGGRDFDQILIEHFKADMMRKYDDIFNYKLERRIKDCCIRLKIKLSTQQKHSLAIYCVGGHEDCDYTLTLSRTKFESLTENLLKRAKDLVERCLREAGLSKGDINKVILVGGTTRIPKVREMLSSYFSNTEIKTDLNPDEAVALGAAIQAAMIKEKFIELEKYKVTEITPLSLGVDSYGDLMNVQIKKNTPLPARSTSIFVTTFNDQKSVKIKIVEGERKMAKFNNILGSLVIENLPKGKSGDVKLEVIFYLNEDGILEVESRETSAGKPKKLVVTIGEYRLCDYKIRNIIEDAERNKKTDEVFEKFVRYKSKVNTVCQHIIYDLHKIKYDIDREFVRAKCEDYIDLANDFEYTELDALRVEFKSLKTTIKPIINNIINVSLNVDQDEFIDELPNSFGRMLLTERLRRLAYDESYDESCDESYDANTCNVVSVRQKQPLVLKEK